jgi:hypothetical protein
MWAPVQVADVTASVTSTWALVRAADVAASVASTWALVSTEVVTSVALPPTAITTSAALTWAPALELGVAHRAIDVRRADGDLRTGPVLRALTATLAHGHGDLELRAAGGLGLRCAIEHGASVAGVATRVSSRTAENGSSPPASVAVSAGRSPSARATRSRSWAVRGA